jgi:ankyrin repeat protein
MAVDLRRGAAIAAILLGGLVGMAAADTELPLVTAVKNADVEQARTLIGKGVDVNAPQADGATALHWAVHRNNLQVADLLIRAGAKVNAVNDLGATPLWLSAVNGSGAMIERLLAAGANPNLALASGETPLMTAARTGDVNTVRLLLAHGAKVNATGFRGQTALMWAAEQQHTEVVRTLVENGADVHARSEVWRQLENTAGNANPAGDFEMAHGGSTPLFFAARTGSVATARVLLDAGAPVNDRAADGTSPLVVAAHSGHGALAAYLVERGADVNSAGSGYTALHAAVIRGDVDLVKALLAHGADANATLQHGTPGRRLGADYSLRYQMIGANAFWLAARFGEIPVLKVLVDANSSAFAVPKDGTTSLKAAMGFVRGFTENRQYRYGVTPMDAAEEEKLTLEAARIALDLGVDVNAADNTGETALHDAVRRGFDSVIALLAEYGADVNARNRRKETPLAMALAARPDIGVSSQDSRGRQSTIDLLRRLGAKE